MAARQGSKTNRGKLAFALFLYFYFCRRSEGAPPAKHLVLTNTKAKDYRKAKPIVCACVHRLPSGFLEATHATEVVSMNYKNACTVSRIQQKVKMR